MKTAAYLGQGQSQKPFKGLEVKLRTTVEGIKMSLATQPVDRYQNLGMSRQTYIGNTNLEKR